MMYEHIYLIRIQKIPPLELKKFFAFLWNKLAGVKKLLIFRKYNNSIHGKICYNDNI